MKIPIAETFHSPQGEATWAGTPMFFIRLAGCCVGSLNTYLPRLSTGRPTWQCKTWDGRAFACDTDFNKQFDTDETTLLAEAREAHVCITGGEPLAHAACVRVLEETFADAGRRVHIETSGTILYIRSRPDTWITCAPKEWCLATMLHDADEIKLLVDERFDPQTLPLPIIRHKNVWLQPINYEKEVNMKNLQRCLALLEQYPQWRLSTQLHKFINVR